VEFITALFRVVWRFTLLQTLFCANDGIFLPLHCILLKFICNWTYLRVEV